MPTASLQRSKSVQDMTLNHLRLQSWRMRSATLLPLFSDLLARVIVPDRVPSMDQMEMFNNLSEFQTNN